MPQLDPTQPPAATPATSSLPTNGADVGDDELVRRSRNGDHGAFATLVRQHQGEALRLAMKYLGNPALAKEASQETFVEIYRYLPRYEGRGAFRLFLKRVLLNRCRMAARSRRGAIRTHEEYGMEPQAAVTLPDEQLLANERRTHVHRALQSLSEKTRGVVLLRFSAGLSLEQIAETLEIPLGTVKSRLFAGLEQLREALEGVQL